MRGKDHPPQGHPQIRAWRQTAGREKDNDSANASDAGKQVNGGSLGSGEHHNRQVYVPPAVLQTDTAVQGARRKHQRIHDGWLVRGGGGET